MGTSNQYRIRSTVYITTGFACLFLIFLQTWSLILLQKRYNLQRTSSRKNSISPLKLLLPLIAANIIFVSAAFFYLCGHLDLFDSSQHLCGLIIPFCGVLYVVGKCFIWLFFAIRASVSQGIIQNFPAWIMKWFLPGYIVGVFVIYAICFPLFFYGKKYQSTNVNTIDTHCDLGEFPSWMTWLGAFADAASSFMFVALFAYPLHQSLKMSEENFKNKQFGFLYKINTHKIEQK